MCIGLVFIDYSYSFSMSHCAMVMFPLQPGLGSTCEKSNSLLSKDIAYTLALGSVLIEILYTGIVCFYSFE